jgi:hypothetical protein
MESTQRVTASAVGVGAPVCAVRTPASARSHGPVLGTTLGGRLRPMTGRTGMAVSGNAPTSVDTQITFTRTTFDTPTGPFREPPV